MSSVLKFSPEFVEACRRLWRDGYDKGVSGDDDYPDFSQYFPESCLPATTPSPSKKADTSYEDMEKLPFNPSKCEARVEKYGFAIQCTRSPFGDGCLCKTHQKMFDDLPEGKDIPYGRFNKPRPDVTLDKGNPIKWGAKQRRGKSVKSQDTSPSVPKLRVGEMRDYLATRVAVTVFRGMKKNELTVLYMSEKEKEKSTPPSTPESKSDMDSPVDSSPVESSQVDKNSEVPVEEDPVEEDPVEDDGKGCGLNLVPLDSPKTVSDYKVLFDKLGIDYSELKGGRAYKEAYSQYLKEKEKENEKESDNISERTEAMSDDDGDVSEEEELKMDENSYDEICFEGVTYYEEEDTGNIYNTNHQQVGKWNSDMDDIIWISDEFKSLHENHSR
jgi:hypothetical protein